MGRIMFPIYKIKVPAHPLDFCDMVLDAAGMEVIGHGFFAEVFGKPHCDRVYKIAEWSEADGYCTFLRTLSQQAQQNPFLPKVFGVWIISYPENENCQYYLAALEKLTPYEDSPDSVELASAVRQMLAAGIQLPAEPDALEQALSLLAATKQESFHDCFDIHNGNIMLRQKQLVITDPLI